MDNTPSSCSWVSIGGWAGGSTSSRITEKVTARHRLTHSGFVLDDWGRMDTEQAIAEIEWLEHVFAVPDTRPLTPSDLSAANRKHDQKLANSPWFRLWQRYGVCCRTEAAPVVRLGET